ncbi:MULTISPECIES: hypothetical protein [unclassified Clostridium]|uniref:hypothetical protein n=1 Tax=unclassified Clostridium TaxID=2614128 RepID=UPI0025BC7489|nr:MULTISPECIES: hypothetical protein [unclassified Clostridium]
MKKAADLFISFILSIWTFLIFAYKMILSSDIPVSIFLNELINFIIGILIYTIIQLSYIKKTKLYLLNLTLLIMPITFWGIMLLGALTYKYHVYDTISDIIGFSCTLIIFLCYCSKVFNYRRKSKIN